MVLWMMGDLTRRGDVMKSMACCATVGSYGHHIRIRHHLPVIITGVSGTFSSRANITNQRALETVFDCFVPHVGLDVLIHPAIRLFLGRRLAQHVFSSFREGSFASCGVQK